MNNQTKAELEKILSQACTEAIAAIVPPGEYPLDREIITQALSALEKVIDAEVRGAAWHEIKQAVYWSLRMNQGEFDAWLNRRLDELDAAIAARKEKPE